MIEINQQEFLTTLQQRLTERHPEIDWPAVQTALLLDNQWEVLARMEATGGEVDLVNETDDTYVFFDCAEESPVDRRAVCYDEAALVARKKNKPATSMEQLANEIGAAVLTEEDYRYLQMIGDFDQKSESWLATDPSFSQHGDALFGRKRHGRTFVYYNGVQSYYSSRAFRCKFTVNKR